MPLAVFAVVYVTDADAVWTKMPRFALPGLLQTLGTVGLEAVFLFWMLP